MSDLQCPIRVLLVRHAEAEYESALLADTGGSLTPVGREQAREVGERLHGERVAVVVSSAMSRAVQTAELMAGVLDAHVLVREGLEEIGSGDFRGRPAEGELFDPTLNAWRAGDLEARVPGGESGQEAAARVWTVLDPLADRFRGETVVVVGHGGTMLAALVSAGLRPDGDFRIANGAVLAVEGDGDGWRIPDHS